MKPRRAELIFWLVVAGALPAYANNPPQADGVLSLILIFPAAILGFRLAGARLNEKELKHRIGKGFLLGLVVFLTLGGTEIALIPLVILLVYGLRRGGQIIQRGQGGKRIAIGLVVMLWTVFAIFDYLVSLGSYPRTAMYEASAVGTLRSISTAEVTFKTTPDASGKPPDAYGTLEQLQQARLIDDRIITERGRRPYEFNLALDSARQQFLLSAVPVKYITPESNWPFLLPGYSLIEANRPRGARRSFAVDETGVIRQADLGGARTVTREQARKWKTLD